jgi:hypothetical protein
VLPAGRAGGVRRDSGQNVALEPLSVGDQYRDRRSISEAPHGTPGVGIAPAQSADHGPAAAGSGWDGPARITLSDEVVQPRGVARNADSRPTRVPHSRPTRVPHSRTGGRGLRRSRTRRRGRPGGEAGRQFDRQGWCQPSGQGAVRVIAVHAVVHRCGPEPAGVVEAQVVEASLVAGARVGEDPAFGEGVVAYAEHPDETGLGVGDEQFLLVQGVLRRIYAIGGVSGTQATVVLETFFERPVAPRA